MNWRCPATAPQEKPCLHVRELIEAMLFVHDHAAGKLNCFNIFPIKNAATVRSIAEAVVCAAGLAETTHLILTETPPLSGTFSCAGGV